MADKSTTLLLKVPTPGSVGVVPINGEGLSGIVKLNKDLSIHMYFECQYPKGTKNHDYCVVDTGAVTLVQTRSECRRVKLELMEGDVPAETRRTANLAKRIDFARQAGTPRLISSDLQGSKS